MAKISPLKTNLRIPSIVSHQIGRQKYKSKNTLVHAKTTHWRDDMTIAESSNPWLTLGNRTLDIRQLERGLMGFLRVPNLGDPDRVRIRRILEWHVEIRNLFAANS